MRIAIFGRPGSGKSTFSVNLSEKLNLPLYHLDKYFFAAGWQERPYDDFLRDQQKIVATKNWIIDGNSLKSLGIRYMNADVAIYFYLPMRICLFRIFKRLFHRDPRIKDRAENCPTKVDWKLIKYMWKFDTQVQTRGGLNYLKQLYPNVSFYKVQSDSEATELMKTICAQPSQK